MTPPRTDQQLAHAQAAAEAAVSLLPSSTPLSAGEASRAAETVSLTGQAVCARFNGAAQGEVIVVVGQDLVEALRNTPLGSLDVAQAVRPALEAAAATVGTVVVDPGHLADPLEAITALVAGGGAFVPLTDDDDGSVRAMVGLAVVGPLGTASAAAPAGLAAAGLAAGAPAAFASGPVLRAGLELLHDVEMEVTAELGRTRMAVRDLLSLIPGAVIELDRAAGGPADLLVNGRLIARGEVVVIDENFGIRVTEIVVPTADRAAAHQ